MTLSAEQFNKLVTRDEFNELKDDVTETNENVKKILTSMDGIISNHNKFEQEKIFNQAAHDRIQGEIEIVKKQVKQAV